jgi:hypothetical protein
MALEQFSLEEAQWYIGRTVIAKTDVDMGHAWVLEEEQGTVVGIDGGYTARGALVFCLVVQLWPARERAYPTVLFFDKYISILKFFQVDNAGMLRMTSSARYFKEGVGSRRPNCR